MSLYKHPLDDIHEGDYVVMEVTAKWDEPDYIYTISGPVRMHDGVKAVGRNGLGEGKIIEHRQRPLPTAFGSHIRYPGAGVEWVKTSADYWCSDEGKSYRTLDMRPGWVLVRDAGVKS